jgi:ABC-type oligopeptide transport system substrate-binding subunit
LHFSGRIKLTESFDYQSIPASSESLLVLPSGAAKSFLLNHLMEKYGTAESSQITSINSFLSLLVKNSGQTISLTGKSERLLIIASLLLEQRTYKNTLIVKGHSNAESELISSVLLSGYKDGSDYLKSIKGEPTSKDNDVAGLCDAYLEKLKGKNLDDFITIIHRAIKGVDRTYFRLRI